ncbi:MAG: hypothetical protein ACYTGR_01985 [Planctomycetota bacterium]|jgi:uncharacterized membrane protein YvbJ
MIDEGPSADDIDRFGGDTGYCPHCGEEVWDQAPQCPSCGTWIEGGVGGQRPDEAWFKRRMTLFILIVVIVAFILVFVL